MPIKLYCDNVYNNGDNGETFNSDKIYYNLESINKGWFNQFINSLSENNSSSGFLTAGRFMVIISMTFDRREQGMIIMDLQQNEERAINISNGREDIEERGRFMTAFYEGLEINSIDSDKFILVEGSLPNLAT